MRWVLVPALLLVFGCDGVRERPSAGRPGADASAPDASWTDGAVDRDAQLDLDGGFPDGGGQADALPADTGPLDDWPQSLAAGEIQMLDLVNQLRAQGANCGGTDFPPSPPLAMNAQLRVAARLHSKDMADQGYFDHTGLDGSTPGGRVAAQGYSGFAIGENIAAGNATAEATFQQWLTSPGHCRNMMESNFNEIGIGHAFNSSSQYRDYWTQNLGGR